MKKLCFQGVECLKSCTVSLKLLICTQQLFVSALSLLIAVAKIDVSLVAEYTVGVFSADFIHFVVTLNLFDNVLALLNVKAVYARILSKSAWQVFDEYGIAVEYDTLVEYIVNRKGDGMCPFESAVLNVADPTSAYKVIRGKMRDMNIML